MRFQDPEFRFINQDRSRKRKLKRTTSTTNQIVKQWRIFINDHPLQFVCTSCEQLFFRKQLKLFRGRLSHCLKNNGVKEDMPVIINAKSRRWICCTCNNHISNGRIPPHSVQNGTHLNEVPTALKNFNKIEEKSVAKR